MAQAPLTSSLAALSRFFFFVGDRMLEQTSNRVANVTVEAIPVADLVGANGHAYRDAQERRDEEPGSHRESQGHAHGGRRGVMKTPPFSFSSERPSGRTSSCATWPDEWSITLSCAGPR